MIASGYPCEIVSRDKIQVFGVNLIYFFPPFCGHTHTRTHMNAYIYIHDLRQVAAQTILDFSCRLWPPGFADIDTIPTDVLLSPTVPQLNI